MDSEPKRASPRTFSVAASPLNDVKFDLGVILLVGLLLLFVVDRFTPDRLGQLGLLGGYGILGLVWIVVRARRVLRRYVEKGGGGA